MTLNASIVACCWLLAGIAIALYLGAKGQGGVAELGWHYAFPGPIRPQALPMTAPAAKSLFHLRAAAVANRQPEAPWRPKQEREIVFAYDARPKWWEALASHLKYVSLLLCAIILWACAVLRAVCWKPKDTGQKPLNPPGARGLEWVLSDTAAALHRHPGSIPDVAFPETQTIRRQRQAARDQAAVDAVSALKAALQREREVSERERGALQEHVALLKADRSRTDRELEAAQAAARRREEALAQLRDAEMEVVRLQASLMTTRQTAFAWMGLLMLLGAMLGFLLGTTIGLLALGLVVATGAFFLYTQRTVRQRIVVNGFIPTGVSRDDLEL